MREVLTRFAIAACFAASGAAFAAEEPGVPVLGVDEQGVPIEAVLTKRVYSQRLRKVMMATQLSTEPALRATHDRKGWRLRTVVVGVGLDLGIGLGPIFSINATPRFRLAFSNQADPALP